MLHWAWKIVAKSVRRKWSRAEKASRAPEEKEENRHSANWAGKAGVHMANKQLENNGIVYGTHTSTNQKIERQHPRSNHLNHKENEKMLLRTIGSQIGYMMMCSSILQLHLLWLLFSSLALSRRHAPRHHHHLFLQLKLSIRNLVWCYAR